MTCEHARNIVEPLASGEIELTPEMRAHFETCPVCASAFATARRIDALLQADPVPLPPARFVTQVLQRVRLERWKSEQRVDRLFNIAMVFALVVVLISVLALVNLSGVITAASGAGTLIARVGHELARQAAPAIGTYIGAGCLLATALGMWWWAERRVSM